MNEHITNLYAPDELRAKIASNDYGAELLLQHAMINIGRLEEQKALLMGVAIEAMKIVAKIDPVGAAKWLKENGG